VPVTEIAGDVEPGFEGVDEAFRRNFDEHGEIGAAVCVMLDGRPVIDLWGGIADTESGRPWDRDTLTVVFSSTKGATAACVHRLVERGELDLDAPVANVWPEFAAQDKQAITLRQVLSHRAGVPVVEAKLTNPEIFDWNPVVEAIAAQAPLWPPGSEHGYHARTFGWILGELLRRTRGESAGRVFAREIAEPLGLDFFVGLPDRLEPRVARLVPPAPPDDPDQRALIERLLGPDTLLGRVLNGPGDLAYGDVWNTHAIHVAEMPSSNGIADARSLARLYAALIGEVDHVRLLRPETLDAACVPHSEGRDRVIQIPTRIGLGFMLAPTVGTACGPASFGHPGAGGSLGFADPERGLAFGYAMNQMKLGMMGDERTIGLVGATYAALEKLGR
jgi:CubicO group peptidase (beta-lactamase class C family)